MDLKSDLKKHKYLVLILAAALIFLMGVQSALAGWIRFPDVNLSSFLPLVLKDPSTSTSTATGTLYVFSSGATTNGNANGRAGLNFICSDEDPAAHFCNIAEIENAMASGGVYFRQPFFQAWVDRPFLGSLVTYQIDGILHPSSWSTQENCLGWTTSNVGQKGTWIGDQASTISLQPNPDGSLPGAACSQANHVACCK